MLQPMRKTKKLVQALINRLDLLLHVNIAPADGEGSLVRSISSYTSEQSFSELILLFLCKLASAVVSEFI